MYIEAYGNVYRNFKFIALRFKKPIIRMRFTKDIEPIDTNNILVLYSDTNIQFNTLTFVVNAKSTTNAIPAKSGCERDLLLATLEEDYIYMHSFHDSTLYVVGSTLLSTPYETIPKNIAFRALYTLSKHGLENTLDLEHFKLCKYFIRNKLQWKKWHSWWNLVQNVVKADKFINEPLSLQMAKRISNIYKHSQKNFKLEYSDLYKCEIELTERPFLGIIYKVENHTVVYISPMIISKSNSDKPFNDVNQYVCNRWLPLYFNKYIWLNEGMYFYIRDLNKKLIDLKKILAFLEGTTIEKFNFILTDLKIVHTILTHS